MFKEEITTTALTGGMADECFSGRITANKFRNDVSMEAACRVLFDKRLAEGESIQVRFDSSFYSADYNVSDIKAAAESLIPGQIRVFSISCRKEDSGKWKSDVKSALKESGLYEMDDLEKWMEAGKTQAVIFTNRPHVADIPKSPLDNDRTIVVIENMITTRWHLVGALLSRLLAKWFQAMPRTEEETKRICNGLLAETPDAFLKAVSDYASSFDFRGMSIRRMLGDFETKYESERLQELERKTQRIDEQIDSHSREIGSLLTQKEDILAMLFGYRTRSQPVEPVTMNYFLANKNLYLQRVTRDYIDFYATSWLSNWDPDKAKATFAKNHCSSWLEHCAEFKVSDEDAKLLYNAIFIEESVKVRLWSHFKLALRGDSPLNVMSDNCIPEITNALPNPHHHYNQCPGGNRGYVNQCIADRDIVGAVEQCISATAGINLTEHASYQYFAKDLFDPSFGKVIYINELGTFKSTKDAIAWLKEKNGKEEAKKAKEAAKHE